MIIKPALFRLRAFLLLRFMWLLSVPSPFYCPSRGRNNSTQLNTVIWEWFICLFQLLASNSGVNCRYEQEFQQLIDSKSGTLITRSATFKSREGNSIPRYAHLGNAIGSIS